MATGPSFRSAVEFRFIERSLASDRSRSPECVQQIELSILQPQHATTLGDFDEDDNECRARSYQQAFPTARRSPFDWLRFWQLDTIRTLMSMEMASLPKDRFAWPRTY